MQRQRRSDTKPELQLRRELWRRGLRYRIDQPIIGKRRRHDIVFTRARVAVEVFGCFWHGCPIHATAPKANAEWWRHKLETNKRRDAESAQRLEEAGWKVVVMWECEDIGSVAD